MQNSNVFRPNPTLHTFTVATNSLCHFVTFFPHFYIFLLWLNLFSYWIPPVFIKICSWTSSHQETNKHRYDTDDQYLCKLWCHVRTGNHVLRQWWEVNKIDMSPAALLLSICWINDNKYETSVKYDKNLQPHIFFKPVLYRL